MKVFLSHLLFLGPRILSPTKYKVPSFPQYRVAVETDCILIIGKLLFAYLFLYI